MALPKSLPKRVLQKRKSSPCVDPTPESSYAKLGGRMLTIRTASREDTRSSKPGRPGARLASRVASTVHGLVRHLAKKTEDDKDEEISDAMEAIVQAQGDKGTPKGGWTTISWPAGRRPSRASRRRSSLSRNEIGSSFADEAEALEHAARHFSGTSSSSEHETVASCSDSQHSPAPSAEEMLGMEVGVSARDYLEECFTKEVSILDREKFNAIPTFVKSDFAISCHLGKGNYSDVFEIVPRAKSSEQQSGLKLVLRGRRATFDVPTGPSEAGEQRVLALKCLRPQIRSDFEEFATGAEDLVHETAMLASLSHRNIINIHGRASGRLAEAFALDDGYFVLLDRLAGTLEDRIESWKNPSRSPQDLVPERTGIARDVADAIAYLHSRRVAFLDLKPANVGFDAVGTVKLFDFGFAAGLPEKDAANPEGKLYERCGTTRYMAPEVGLGRGHGLPADVHSFGVLLWEMWALAKPFGDILNSRDFESAVFVGGRRPAVGDRWPAYARELMVGCWSSDPDERPSMPEVLGVLSTEAPRREGVVAPGWTRRRTDAL